MITGALILALNSCEKNAAKKTAGNMASPTNGSIFPKGNQGSSEWFTGTVWVTPLMQPNENLHYSIGDVKFEPRSRTHWHTHPIEQVLLVTEGFGVYQEKDKQARPLKKGDIVVIPPHTEHWHGAAPDNHFTHVAITNYKDGSNVTWLSPVSEEEYKNISPAL